MQQRPAMNKTNPNTTKQLANEGQEAEIEEDVSKEEQPAISLQLPHQEEDTHDEREMRAKQERQHVEDKIDKHGRAAQAESLAQAARAMLSTKITPAIREWANRTTAEIHSMMAMVKNESEQDADGLRKRFASFAVLAKKLNDATKKANAVNGKLASAASQTHLSCRSIECQLVNNRTLCIQELQELKSDSEFADIRASLSAAHGKTCTSDGALPESELLPAQKSWITDLLGAFAAGKIAAEKLDQSLQKQLDKSQEFKGLLKRLSAKRVECDSSQTTWENAACNYAQSVNTACQIYKATYAVDKEAYDATLAHTKLRDDDRNVEFASLHRTSCVLKLIAAVSSDGGLTNATKTIQQCYAANLSMSDWLVIDYKEAPEELSCPPLPSYPCSEDFISTEYGDLQEGCPASKCNTTCDLPRPKPQVCPPRNSTPLTILLKGSSLPSGYTLSFPGGSDTRVYYQAGDVCKEIDRHVEGGQVYFATQNDISSDNGVHYHYTVGTPGGKSNAGAVFLLFDDFSYDSGLWKQPDPLPKSNDYVTIADGHMKMVVDSGRTGKGHPGELQVYFDGVGAKDWTDYELHVDWKCQDYTQNDYPGPLMRVQDTSKTGYTALWFEYHMASINSHVCCLRAAHKTQDNNWKHTWNGPMDAKLDFDWHTSKIKLVGAQFWHSFTNGGKTYKPHQGTQMNTFEQAAKHGTMGLTSHRGYGGKDGLGQCEGLQSG